MTDKSKTGKNDDGLSEMPFAGEDDNVVKSNTGKNDDGLSEMPFAGEDDNVVKANTSNNDAKDNKDALD